MCRYRRTNVWYSLFWNSIFLRRCLWLHRTYVAIKNDDTTVVESKQPQLRKVRCSSQRICWNVVNLICTLYYPFGFLLFHALTVEGYHVYFNCRYVYHNSTSARAEMSLMTVCYKKQSRTAQGSRSWGLWTSSHSLLTNNLFPPMSNTQFSKQSSFSSVFDQSRCTPKRVELWFLESSFVLFLFFLYSYLSSVNSCKLSA